MTIVFVLFKIENGFNVTKIYFCSYFSNLFLINGRVLHKFSIYVNPTDARYWDSGCVCNAL